MSRLIYADALKDSIEVHFADGIHVYDTFAELIDEQPTIEERKKGEWIIHETETDRYDDMKCPFCKKSYTVDAYRIDDIGFTAADFNFCPNCGASMTDKREGEKNRN